MALIIEQTRRGVNWFGIFVFIFLLLVIVGGGYFLFFGPTPAIEIISPVELGTADKIAGIKLDATKIIGSPVLKNFREYGTTPGVGILGRPNPFIPL
ncbi:MAG: hypothetical protein EXS60_02075 [Candidatus Pacebacteria bacterium]|nr:hypothetical protein [Candidatus Paceibacterota bacterium]